MGYWDRLSANLSLLAIKGRGWLRLLVAGAGFVIIALAALRMFSRALQVRGQWAALFHPAKIRYALIQASVWEILLVAFGAAVAYAAIKW